MRTAENLTDTETMVVRTAEVVYNIKVYMIHSLGVLEGLMVHA